MVCSCLWRFYKIILHDINRKISFSAIRNFLHLKQFYLWEFGLTNHPTFQKNLKTVAISQPAGQSRAFVHSQNVIPIQFMLSYRQLSTYTKAIFRIRLKNDLKDQNRDEILFIQVTAIAKPLDTAKIIIQKYKHSRIIVSPAVATPRSPVEISV